MQDFTYSLLENIYRICPNMLLNLFMECLLKVLLGFWSNSFYLFIGEARLFLGVHRREE